MGDKKIPTLSSCSYLSGLSAMRRYSGRLKPRPRSADLVNRSAKWLYAVVKNVEDGKGPTQPLETCQNLCAMYPFFFHRSPYKVAGLSRSLLQIPESSKADEHSHGTQSLYMHMAHPCWMTFKRPYLVGDRFSSTVQLFS